MDATGLTLSGDVESRVLKLARHHHVPVRRYDVALRDSGEALRELGDITVSDQIHCLEPMLQVLETHLPDITRRAQAWSVGDVDAIQALPIPDDAKGCGDAVSGASTLVRVGRDAHAGWIRAVETALASNESTLALQDIDTLVGPRGWLDELRAAGYTVEGPVRPEHPRPSM
jgi:hypothetical protein